MTGFARAGAFTGSIQFAGRRHASAVRGRQAVASGSLVDVGALGETLDRDDPLSLPGGHQLHSLRVTPRLADLVDARAKSLSAVGDQHHEMGFRMQAEAARVFDVAGESDAVKKLYGLDDPVTADFGWQCVLARRLAEADVRFIQCTHSYKWDQHSDLFQKHNENAAEVDKPIAGLLKDLKARGLLKDTLVIWSGEFGRTPVSQGGNGRDHNPYGYSLFMAGGGVKPGFAYGATDEFGYHAAENRMHIHDFHATVLAALGLDHLKLTYRYSGRDFRLTDTAGNVHDGIFA